MKKAFLFRVFAIVFFLLASLAIKSETSSCKLKCSSLIKDRVSVQSLLFNEQREVPVFPNDGFFIKI